jgi:hypothetical protein
MLKYGHQYVDKGAEYYEQKNRQQQLDFIRKRAAQLGLVVTPACPVRGACGFVLVANPECMVRRRIASEK